MNKQAVITAVLGLLVLGLAVDDMRQRARVGELQEQVDSLQAELDAAPKAPTVQGSPKPKLKKMTKAPGRGLSEGPAIVPPGSSARGSEAAVDARRAERQEQFQGELDLYLDAFADEHQLNEATTAEMESLVLDAMEELSEAWAGTRTGEVDRNEARELMDELGVQLELDLAEQIGATEAQAFMDELPGPLGQGKPLRPGGR